MTDQQGPENHLSYEDLAQDLAGGAPQDVYGPQEQEPGVAREPNPEPSLSDQLSEQINKVLDQYTKRLVPQLAEVMDKKIAAAINGLTAAAGQNGYAHRQELPDQEPAPAGGTGDVLISALIQAAPAIISKVLGLGGGQGNVLGGFEAQLTQYANMMNIAKGTFVDTHMESMRTGMKLTADAYTYAYKATGVVPDNVGFNAQVGGPEDISPTPEPAMARRRQVDVDAIAKGLVPKLVA